MFSQASSASFLLTDCFLCASVVDNFTSKCIPHVHFQWGYWSWSGSKSLERREAVLTFVKKCSESSCVLSDVCSKSMNRLCGSI